MALSKRTKMLTVAAALSGALLAGCAAPAPTATPTSPPAAAVATPTKAPTATPTKRPLVKAEAVQATLSLSYTPAFVAKEKGFFLEEGLDLSFVQVASGAQGVAAVLGRSAQISHTFAADIVTAIGQGQPLRALAQLSTGISAWLIINKQIAEQRGITSKMALEEKGKAVKGLTFAATGPGSGSDYRIRFFLKKAGLDPDRDVNITYVGSAGAMVAAFEQGAVHAYTIGDAQQVLPPLEQGKAVMLVDFMGGEIPGTEDTYMIVAVAHRDELERQAELFEAYARGLWRAYKLMAERESEARNLARKYMAELDEAMYQKAWDLNRPSLPKEPTLTSDRLKATLDFRNATAPPPPLDVKFEDFGTNRFVEAAKKQLGF